jgi:hypothetical protein
MDGVSDDESVPTFPRILILSSWGRTDNSVTHVDMRPTAGNESENLPPWRICSFNLITQNVYAGPACN